MAADLPIPVFTNLKDLYANLGTSLNHAERWNNLTEEFVKRFGRKPAYIARAPGRVNLIGEHIDYALFGVFPAAVEQDILIACAPRAPELHRDEEHHSQGGVLADNLHDKYTQQSFAPKIKSMFKTSATSDADEVEDAQVHAEQWHLDIDTKQLRWESYVKAGYYGVLNHYFSPQSTLQSHPTPVDLLVTGSVPAGSGLSSSAAMVVASTLAFLAVNDKLDDHNSLLTKGQLVQMAVENEKRVGVNSGGMDQAASVISLPLSALYITFYPKLSASPTSLPSRAVFVCANSLVVADKVVSARYNYNLRVVETLVAARVLAKNLNVIVGPKERITLREVIGRLVSETKDGKGEGGGMEIPQLREALEKGIQALDGLKGKDEKDGEGVVKSEMIAMTGMEEKEFEEVYLSWVDVEATHFKLYKRAKHVFSEALRVLEFRDICERAKAADSSNSDSVLQELGQLMNASQTSCSQDFQCSCPELNELTQLARESGAYGSRLTGAGWGGCTVSLVAEADVESFVAKMKRGYKRFNDLAPDALQEVLFATKPSNGACVYKFE